MKVYKALEKLMKEDLLEGVFISVLSNEDIVMTESEYSEREFKDKKIRHLKTIRDICDEKLDNLVDEKKNKMIG